MIRRRCRVLAAGLLGVTLISGCGSTMTDGGTTQPPPPQTLDDQLRAQFGIWGVVPIGAVTPPNATLVDLGRSLFFDKILSGNRDVAWATCHSPLSHGADVLALSIGPGGSGAGPARTFGTGRQFAPRNPPSLINTGLGSFYI